MVNRKLASSGRAKIRTLSVQPVPARRAPQRGRTCGDQDARSSVAPRLVHGGTGHGREQHDGRDLNPPAQLKTSEATLSRAEHTGDDAARNPRRRPHKTTTAAPSEGQGEGGAQGGPGDSKPRPRAHLSLGTDLRAHAGCLQQPHPSQSLRACRRTRPGGGHPPPTKASGPGAAPAQGEGTPHQPKPQDLPPHPPRGRAPPTSQSLRTCRRTRPGGGHPGDTAGTRAPRPSHRGPCPLQAATGCSNPSSNQHQGRILHQPLWQSDAASPAVPSLLSPVPSTNPRPPPKELTDVCLPASGPGVQVPGKMQMSCASPPPLQGWAESQGHLQGPRPRPLLPHSSWTTYF